MLETKKCYIRRAHSQWVEGKSHHRAALQLYMILYADRVQPGIKPAEATISTEHASGGQFVAQFSYVDESVYQFVDNYENIVQIMMEEPERVAYINRIME